ncbi:MAG: response regulator transcription factor [Flavobacteriales bacterium]|nr:response regulator transcription factor [Flavobacteriales bacterium]
MKILIVEDEVAALKRMTKLLAEIEPSATIVANTTSVADTVEWLKANPAPDLAFFDVRLTDGDSFAVFQRAVVDCPVVFTTAFDEYALKAFKVHAVDYLLKPVKLEDLAATMSHIKAIGTVRELAPLAAENVADDDRPISLIKRFLIRYGDHYRVVEPKDIAYIYSMEKSTFLRTLEGRDLPLDESLDRLERQLDPEKFFRLNRQVIIHFQSIKELVAYSKSRVKVIMVPPFGEDAVVSSERSAEFKRWLAGG